MRAPLFLLVFSAALHLHGQGLLNNGAKLVLGTGVSLELRGSNGDLTSAAGSSIDNRGAINLQGDWVNNAGSALFINTGNNGEVSFNGTVAQTVGGSGAINFEKLRIANTSGVTLQRTIAVSGTLTLSSGALRLDTCTLSLGSGAGSAISRSSGYLVSEQTNNSGKVKWSIGTNTGLHVFPFGTSSGEYIPFALELTAGDIGQVTVSTYPTNVNNLPYPSTPVAVTHVQNASGNDNSINTVDRFWQIDKTGAGGTATLTFTAASVEAGSISDLKAQRWNAATQGWDAPLSGQTNTPNSVTVPGVTSFSPWTMAGSSSPLPVELLSFDAAVKEKHVLLSWITASETDNDFFTIERTKDGVNFETVAVVDGAGNSTQQLRYGIPDPAPHSGISYYRLRQTDFDGSFSHSNFVAVTFEEENLFDLVVAPNPASERINVSVFGLEDAPVSVIVRDLLGNEYYSRSFTAENGTFAVSIDREQGFMPGVYIVLVSSEGKQRSRKVVVQ